MVEPNHCRFCSGIAISFRESKPQEVRAALTEMRDAASGISARMSRALEQTRSTRGKEQER